MIKRRRLVAAVHGGRLMLLLLLLLLLILWVHAGVTPSLFLWRAFPSLPPPPSLQKPNKHDEGGGGGATAPHTPHCRGGRRLQGEQAAAAGSCKGCVVLHSRAHAYAVHASPACIYIYQHKLQNVTHMRVRSHTHARASHTVCRSGCCRLRF